MVSSRRAFARGRRLKRWPLSRDDPSRCRASHRGDAADGGSRRHDLLEKRPEDVASNRLATSRWRSRGRLRPRRGRMRCSFSASFTMVRTAAGGATGAALAVARRCTAAGARRERTEIDADVTLAATDGDPLIIPLRSRRTAATSRSSWLMAHLTRAVVASDSIRRPRTQLPAPP